MIELLTTTMWITLSAYIVYVLATWIYKKFLKPDKDPFFYLKSLIKEGESIYNIRIESPDDDFNFDLSLSINNTIVYTKNAQLKLGINNIKVLLDPSLDINDAVLKMKSDSQIVERKFEEIKE